MIQIVKISVLPKLIYKFDLNPIKSPTSFLMELDKLILKFIWKQCKNSQWNTEKQQRSSLKGSFWRESSPTDIKTFYNASEIKTMDKKTSGME